MEVVKLSEREFKNAVRQQGYVVVDCYAKWCGPCKLQSQIMKKAANDIENVLFYKVDIDEADEIVIEYQITSVPTLLFFKNGKIIRKKVGLISEEDMYKLLMSL